MAGVTFDKSVSENGLVPLLYLTAYAGEHSDSATESLTSFTAHGTRMLCGLFPFARHSQPRSSKPCR